VDAVILWRLLNYFRLDRAVEVGTFQGLTSGLILESNSNCNLLGIDPDDGLDLFRKNNPGIQDRFRFIRSLSQDVILGDQEFDFILLDAAWDYLSIMSDVEKFLPHLSQSGIIAFSYVGLVKSNAMKELHNRNTGWVPFLRSDQTEFWHQPTYNRGEFLDSLFTDPISKFIHIENQIDEFKNTICIARSISMLTDHPEYFDLALNHYDV